MALLAAATTPMATDGHGIVPRNATSAPRPRAESTSCNAPPALPEVAVKSSMQNQRSTDDVATQRALLESLTMRVTQLEDSRHLGISSQQDSALGKDGQRGAEELHMCSSLLRRQLDENVERVDHRLHALASDLAACRKDASVAAAFAAASAAEATRHVPSGTTFDGGIANTAVSAVAWPPSLPAVPGVAGSTSTCCAHFDIACDDEDSDQNAVSAEEARRMREEQVELHAAVRRLGEELSTAVTQLSGEIRSTEDKVGVLQQDVAAAAIELRTETQAVEALAREALAVAGSSRSMDQRESDGMREAYRDEAESMRLDLGRASESFHQKLTHFHEEAMGFSGSLAEEARSLRADIARDDERRSQAETIAKCSAEQVAGKLRSEIDMIKVDVQQSSQKVHELSNNMLLEAESIVENAMGRLREEVDVVRRDVQSLTQRHGDRGFEPVSVKLREELSRCQAQILSLVERLTTVSDSVNTQIDDKVQQATVPIQHDIASVQADVKQFSARLAETVEVSATLRATQANAVTLSTEFRDTVHSGIGDCRNEIKFLSQRLGDVATSLRSETTKTTDSISARLRDDISCCRGDMLKLSGKMDSMSESVCVQTGVRIDLDTVRADVQQLTVMLHRLREEAAAKIEGMGSKVKQDVCEIQARQQQATNALQEETARVRAEMGEIAGRMAENARARAELEDISSPAEAAFKDEVALLRREVEDRMAAARGEADAAAARQDEVASSCRASMVELTETVASAREFTERVESGIRAHFDGVKAEVQHLSQNSAEKDAKLQNMVNTCHVDVLKLAQRVDTAASDVAVVRTKVGEASHGVELGAVELQSVRADVQLLSQSMAEVMRSFPVETDTKVANMGCKLQDDFGECKAALAAVIDDVAALRHEVSSASQRHLDVAAAVAAKAENPSAQSELQQIARDVDLLTKTLRDEVGEVQLACKEVATRQAEDDASLRREVREAELQFGGRLGINEAEMASIEATAERAWSEAAMVEATAERAWSEAAMVEAASASAISDVERRLLGQLAVVEAMTEATALQFANARSGASGASESLKAAHVVPAASAKFLCEEGGAVLASSMRPRDGAAVTGAAAVAAAAAVSVARYQGARDDQVLDTLGATAASIRDQSCEMRAERGSSVRAELAAVHSGVYPAFREPSPKIIADGASVGARGGGIGGREASFVDLSSGGKDGRSGNSVATDAAALTANPRCSHASVSRGRATASTAAEPRVPSRKLGRSRSPVDQASLAVSRNASEGSSVVLAQFPSTRSTRTFPLVQSPGGGCNGGGSGGNSGGGLSVPGGGSSSGTPTNTGLGSTEALDTESDVTLSGGENDGTRPALGQQWRQVQDMMRPLPRHSESITTSSNSCRVSSDTPVQSAVQRRTSKSTGRPWK
eukprot:TRINITY_DN38341_c0_g1_i2.p1 TRINITY_DN38341_c0_g1~~TRINITY_DN38341_c0_g1_i2.p1  ORF type:complete len:1605 (-),score=347.36 TRINITY_DN38341_c0_g1_i2:56-4249(-)